jgi:hypothetical protein
MGFEVGSNPKEIKLWTGLETVSVLAINPTKTELEKAGVVVKEEPVYAKVEEGVRKVRIDVWVKGGEKSNILSKVTFFVEDVEKESQSTPGNYQFINEFGDSAWGQSVEEIQGKYDWFKGEKICRAKSGEADFIVFFKRWLNVGKGQKASIENMTALLSGDLKEFKPLVTTHKDKKAQVLFTVREYEGNWFQSVYNKYFGIAFSTNTTYWKKHLDGSQAVINYQGSLVLQEFNPLSVGEGTSSESTEKDPANPWA